MTPEQLDEIEKLAEAAWPGPWRATPGTDWGHHDGPRAYTLEGANFHTLWSSGSGEYEHPDWGTACFITAMREHALPLVKALREAWAELGEALDELAFIKEEYGDGDPAEMSKDALMLKIRVQSAALDALEQERARLAAEVERLCEVVRKVHGLAGKGNDPTHGWVDSDLYEIHKLTKGEEG